MQTGVRDTIKMLCDEVRTISLKQENQSKASYWKAQPSTARDHWRGTPRSRNELPRAPITVEPELPMWGKILGFDVVRFYTDPVYYLENQLRMTIYRHKEWNDETCVSTEIPIWLGATLESSLFGSETRYAENASPWLDRNPVLRAEEDLDKFEYPSFRRSGLMPLAHRYYEVLNELLEQDFKVTFPEWGRGPFGVAFHIRGFEDLLMDMASNPDFVHKLMRFITDSRKKWTEDRARYLGRTVEKGNLYNDEVNTPGLSPKMYEEFVLPYEQELSQFHGGILYWHSCGDTTELVHLIAKIPNLEMFHVGPWTQGTRCVEVFKNKVPLEFCLHPLRDVQDTQVAGMRAKLAEISEAVKGGPYTVRADGLQVFRGLESDLPQIKEWIEVADEFLKSH